MILRKGLLFVIMLLVLAACKDDDDNDNDNGTPDDHNHDGHGEVALSINHYVGNDAYSPDSSYSNIGGTTVKISRIEYYLSNFVAYGMTMDDTDELDKFLLVSPEENYYELGDVELGHVQMMELIVGLDSITNHQDPTEAEEPLNDANMHWGWNPDAGYKFLVVGGQYDSNNSGAIDASDEYFSYHVATDAMRTMTSITGIHMDNDHDNVNTINLKVDIRDVFDGVDIAGNDTGHGAEDPNTLLITNLSQAFEIE